ncbi:uncharacterized protein PFL1_00819 [Pseudozyma flocculosa PF-1]|uniref:Lysophospholipase n=1 Tax=Pseudozyma flocculosa TaxID=84751 RepID=A0A5C3F3Q0_9BASI|nr:uncharacterized protein PFL1_00819 [Pseudozyma flocculosa PF-1]EPQ31484.1 hypothetical protein PFL1_00819 [Pseudozyma flocculosa PF-1]SPO38730.1 probable lysophospholipase (lpl) [Pseudozyma flocculosa]
MQIFKPLLAALTLLACGASATPTSLSAESLEHLQNLSPFQRRQLLEHLVEIREAQLQKRSSPTGSYAPGNVKCPATTSQQSPGLIRDASKKRLNQGERDYIQRHRESRKQDWIDWLTNSAKLGGQDGVPGGLAQYADNVDNLPRIGFALSGGGLRAMLVGSGVAMGFDSRNQTAKDRGTGGLLQLADYVSGLSGGSWATSTLAMNDWPTAQTLNDEVWNLESNLVIPKDGKIGFYTNIALDVKKKRDLDYGTSITDYFGLSIAQKVLNSTYENKAATTWSDVKDTSNYKAASYPYPIILADQREPGELVVSRNTTIWEFNPNEFGSWNPNVAAFVPIEIVGSSLDNGASVLPDGQCVAGYETLPWVVGTSATLFSGLYLQLLEGQTDSLIANVIKGIAEAVSKEQNDISTVPNPFYGYNEGNNAVAKLRNISLIDAGLTDLNLPLWPLVEPARGLDFVFAVDSSADVSSWPNGSSLYQSSLRAKDEVYKQYPLPDFPSTATFVNRGLNTRPTFFGCDAAAATNSDTSFDGAKTPIIAYIPSYPYTSLANASTYQLEYSRKQSQAVLDNSVDVATLGGADDTWATCLGCAMLQRSFERNKVTRPAACDSCMKKWCWDGVTNDTAPVQAYSPATGVPEFVTSQGSIQKAPAYTGGDGSNPQASDGNSQSITDSSAGDAQKVHVAAVAFATLLAVGAVLL